MGDVKLSGVGLLGIGPKLLASASVFALGTLGAAAPAWAQEVVSEPVTGEQPGAIEPTPQTGASEGQQEEVADGDVIIVTGIRASLRVRATPRKMPSRLSIRSAPRILARSLTGRFPRPCNASRA